MIAQVFSCLNKAQIDKIVRGEKAKNKNKKNKIKRLSDNFANAGKSLKNKQRRGTTCPDKRYIKPLKGTAERGGMNPSSRH